MQTDRPPILSPFYLQYERYPYLRGPNYVRPMFRENERGGNFRSGPIERILAPLALGSDSGNSFGILNIVGIAINATAGYFVGKQLGYSTAGAVATGILGLPGMFGVALYASSRKGKAP